MTIFADAVVIDIVMVRALLAIVMFGSATYFDLRKREVSDFLWIPFAAMAAILYVFDFPSNLSEGIPIILSMGMTAAVAYGIYRAGLFGGADMLALITFSAIMPIYEGTILSRQTDLVFHTFAPIIVLTNAVIFSLAHVIFNIARNLVYYSKRSGALFDGFEQEPAAKKLLAIIVGHRSANPQFAFPIEKTVDGKREFDFALRNAETAEYEDRRDVWVTSGIPYLVYFTAGFLMMIFVGDLFTLIFGTLYR